jgi:hypothetical protein
MTDITLIGYERTPGDGRTRTVHRAFCQVLNFADSKGYIVRRKPNQRFADITAAISSGFAPCPMCKPELRLIASTKSQNLHMESCSCARRLRKNITEFKSFTAALDSGYRICPWCRTPGINSLLNTRPPVRSRLGPLVRAYERMAWIELTLSYAIKRVLVDACGDNAWWKEGIPQNVRQACRKCQEEVGTDVFQDPFQYVTFIGYKEIIDKQWKLFEPALPSDLAADKKSLLKALEKLNALRNRIMHPTKSNDLDKLESDEAFSVGERLDWGRWRFAGVDH